MKDSRTLENPEQATGRQSADEQEDRQQSEHTQKKARGTAGMDPETRKEVARKGGLAVSQSRDHMASIGRKGGLSVSKSRDHMAEIGRKGGRSRRVTKK